MKSLEACIICKGPFRQPDWRRILLIQEQWPELRPVKCGPHEPLSIRYDVGKHDQIIEKCWHARSPKLIWRSEGNVFSGMLSTKFGPMPDYAGVPIWNERDELPDDLGFLSAFAKRVAIDCDGVFGMIHLLAEPEIGHMGAAGVIPAVFDPAAKYRFGISPMILRRWIPELFWATVFGPEYVELFGRARLLSAPCHVAKEIGQAVYVQLTESVFDMLTRFDEVQAARKRVKAHLSVVDAFWRSDAPRDHRYVVPCAFSDE
jgi:hypothetical protein